MDEPAEPTEPTEPAEPAPLPEPAPLSDDELKALAHPLRVRMLDALGGEGPATATQLAARFGETSGATSYHLRQLARHGFVEEDERRGTGRERWWRVKRRGWNIRGYRLRQRDATRHYVDVLLGEMHRGRLERLERWFATFSDWDQDWAEAAAEIGGRIHLTREELARLSEELVEVMLRYARLHPDATDLPPGAGLVDVQLYAFPVAPDDTPTDRTRDH